MATKIMRDGQWVDDPPPPDINWGNLPGRPDIPIGNEATARGGRSVALGSQADAAGQSSVALGSQARVNPAHTGSAAIGALSSTGRTVRTTRPDQIMLGSTDHETVIGGTLTMRAPNGTEYTITVTNDGQLTATPRA